MADSFIVTTGLHSSADTDSRAMELSGQLAAPYVKRGATGIVRILAETGACYALIVQADRLVLSDGDIVYSYHPNMLLVRGLNVLRDWRDVFLDATEFRAGETVLDCTLGFACEASLAALAVGPTGQIIGLESQPALAAVTRAGLADFALETPPLRDAMRRVQVLTEDYTSFLARASERSFDVITFDPFFDERLEGSQHSVSPLVRFGDNRPLDSGAVLRAREVARRRVVVKHPRFTPLAPELSSIAARTITSRKGQTAYSIFDPAE
jgi:hypothetical protein